MNVERFKTKPKTFLDEVHRDLFIKIGAWHTADYVKRHPERALERVLRLRKKVIARGEGGSRVRRLDCVIRKIRRGVRSGLL